ncbi:efflux RND transporter periplasmic adaptor subunit [candidate division KSB1 bacterium]
MQLMKKAVLLISVLLMTIISFKCTREGSTDPIVPRVPVTIEQVSRGDITAFISQTGTIKPIEEMDITAEAGGEIYFKTINGKILSKGDKVSKGQIIAVLNSREYELGVALESKKIALDHAQRNLNDTQKLFDLGGANLREVETAERNLMNAKTSYESAQLSIDKLNVRPPISGIIADIESFSEGQRINSGTKVGKVMKYDNVICELNVTSDDAENIWIDQDVIISDVTAENEQYFGKVSKISPTIDPTTRTVAIEIQINNPELKLKPGSFVKADIVVEKRENVIKIPKNVILTKNRQDVVFVVEDQVAKMKPVELGLQDSEFTEILEGLEEGEILIIRGFEALRTNTKVRISR